MFFTHIGFRARKNRNKANKNSVSWVSQKRLKINKSWRGKIGIFIEEYD